MHPRQVSRDLLIFNALCALYEYADACRPTPIKVTSAMRFALAYLFSQSNGDRSCYDELVELVQRSSATDHNFERDNYIRGTRATSCVHGIMQSIRWNCPAAVHQLITEARDSDNPTAVFIAGIKADPDYPRRG